MFWLAMFAILLQFFLPYVVFQAMGVDTQKVKLHPSTVLVILCGCYALLKGVVSFHQRYREAPGLILFLFAVPVLFVYSIYFTGYSGSATFPETFWSAAMLALMLETASLKQKRLLGGVLIVLCIFNVFVGLYESVTEHNWFPLILDPDAPSQEIQEDFRANAFYSHPLTASLITSMAIFMLYAMRLRFILTAPMFAVLLVGLFAFGGRTALAVTLAVSGLTALFALGAGIVRRNLKLDFVLAIVAASIAIPLMIAVIVTQTSIADRIIDTLYYDGSAQARATQFEVFKYLSLKDWLFGISHDYLIVLKYQIGLGGKDTDIENFWFLMILDLGVIGFSVFVVVFGVFLVHLGRYAGDLNGWLLMISALIIDSGSNSLGTKSCDLFLEVAFLVAISGYAGYRRTSRVVTERRRSRFPDFPSRVKSLGSVVTRSRGLRVLRSKSF